jgi:glycopeptide antibiotics resistance protein
MRIQMEIYKSKKEKIITYTIFAIYILLLCWLVLFKFAISIDMIPNFRGINLIPFHYDQASSAHWREVVFNVIVFIPAGFYFSAMFAKKNILLGTAATAALSLLFEIIQWIFSIGASDITDLITNTVGGFCGMLLFWIMGKITRKHRMTIINVLGIIIEALGVLLLLIVLISNE